MVGVGSSFDLTVKFNGREMNMKYYIIEYKQPYEVVLYGEGNIIKAIDTIKFKRLENNKVEIQYCRFNFKRMEETIYYIYK